jgi:type II secretory pathway pseudopilin PulG
MRSNARQHGFSLLETLLAVSTLAIGMIFVGGTFLTGIYLATVSTERTIATVVADEALAKIRLYGLDLDVPVDECTPYTELETIPPSELRYPSIDANDANAVRPYSWAALCRRVAPESRLVQITVFVSRQTGTNTRYWVRDPNTAELEQVEWPHLVRVNVVQEADDEDDELTIEDAVTSDETDEYTFINDGATIVDDETGQIYRVLERYAEPLERIKLDRPWEGTALTGSDGGWVWVVPRPVAGGRSPFVAVYQEVLRF